MCIRDRYLTKSSVYSSCTGPFRNFFTSLGSWFSNPYDQLPSSRLAKYSTHLHFILIILKIYHLYCLFGCYLYTGNCFPAYLCHSLHISLHTILCSVQFYFLCSLFLLLAVINYKKHKKQCFKYKIVFLNSRAVLPMFTSSIHHNHIQITILTLNFRCLSIFHFRHSWLTFTINFHLSQLYFIYLHLSSPFLFST